MRYLLVLVAIALLAYSNTVTQTDWSGGPGILGPVTDWENCFFSSGANVYYQFGDPILYNSSPPVMHQIDMNCNGARAVHAVDLDGDGDIDVLASEPGNARVAWYENIDCSGRNWVKRVVSFDIANALSLNSFDMDADGDSDILASSNVDGFIVWLENIDGSGINWHTHIVVDSIYQTYSSHWGDFDGDGDIDILGGFTGSFGVFWWENVNGLGLTWVSHEVCTSFEEARSVYSEDINGDGFLDVVAGSYENGDVLWWENTFGYGLYWTEHLVDSSFTGAYSVYSDDVDLDGDMDILGAGKHANEIAWWENVDSFGNEWVKHTVDNGFMGACAVNSGDFDSDGDVDILGACSTGDDVSWWENVDGQGLVWLEHCVATQLNEASSVFSADIDGDGDTDVLASGILADDLIWWEVSPKGGLISSIMDAGDVTHWNTFLASTDQPDGTSICFQFRSSADPSNMGEWSDTLYSSSTSLDGILADSTRYLQYKAILERIDRAITPELEEVSFSYSVLLQVDEDVFAKQNEVTILPLQNPSGSNLSFRINIPVHQIIGLSLYDLTGRLVADYFGGLEKGTHDVCFLNLDAGAYFCKLRSGQFSILSRVVVVR